MTKPDAISSTLLSICLPNQDTHTLVIPELIDIVQIHKDDKSQVMLLKNIPLPQELGSVFISTCVCYTTDWRISWAGDHTDLGQFRCRVMQHGSVTSLVNGALLIISKFENNEDPQFCLNLPEGGTK
jgi:hypothetical protein